jgi:hypothetical protein
VGAWFFSGIGDPQWNVVGYSIPFCPTLLPQITREFQELAEARSMEAIPGTFKPN